ncbi:cytochrome c-type biogenesis protein CcmH [Janthinobacterium sp. 17J80-10]|nr:cytochrome c-type biogenesis protein [Janthinobacterium sp. 17J80-10]QAU36140.1 cytochrome c-type biogenesis protein CcmH [Janthinobacterium sp. 17J80-10]
MLQVLLALPAQASVPAGGATDPVLEKRVAALSEQLRCLVCQNQSLADSNAALALDLKNQVREKLAAGQSEQQVVDYMVARYGDFVLYRPPVKTSTWLLWFGPFVLLAAAVAALLLRLARRRPIDALTDIERQRAAELLAGDDGHVVQGDKP